MQRTLSIRNEVVKTDTWNIKDGVLEYIDDTHTYIYEGEILPSITQMLKVKFGHKYDAVDKTTLDNASAMGTMVHKAIEDFEKRQIETDIKELRNYKFLKKAYKFECVDNEVPVVLFQNDVPIACGRLDLVLEENGKLGLGDIKRTSTLDKNYLAYQLNLYRIAYQQDYSRNIEFLRGIHLREDVRKYIELPIDETLADEIIKAYRGAE